MVKQIACNQKKIHVKLPGTCHHSLKCHVYFVFPLAAPYKLPVRQRAEQHIGYMYKRYLFHQSVYSNPKHENAL